MDIIERGKEALEFIKEYVQWKDVSLPTQKYTPKELVGIILVSTTSSYAIYKLVAFINRTRKSVKLYNDIPGPPIHWFWGNIFNHPGPTEEGYKWARELVEKYPKMHVVYLGRWRPCLQMTHPDTAKLILKTASPKQFAGGGGYTFLIPWLGFGLLLSGGSQWARNRRLLTPGFHFEILKPYMEIYNRAADKLLQKWEVATVSGKSMEIHKPVSLCTLDVILQCAFSYKGDIQEKGDDEPYVNAVIAMGKQIFERAFNPLMYIDFLYYLSKGGKKFQQNVTYSHRVAYNIINNRKNALKESQSSTSKRYVDFLDILLLARDEQGNGLSDVEIRQEVDTFLFEGHDTTASAISWILLEIAKHPEIQERCYKEIKSVLGSRGNDDIEWDDLNNFPYITLCIKEGLRMHSPVHNIGRQLAEPMEIEGRVFPVGTLIDIPIYQVHHNKLVWGDDHMEYKPERFESENINKMDSYAFVPFSAGPRNCIGQQFAMHEIKVIVARVLLKFKLTVDESIPVRYLSDVVMRSENGIHLHSALRN